ncbi:hypothetical protein FPHYL_516 [Fusarium phyllophilum]|uniref:Uncharacterized protein n=1 Tax=Fusarium phyllophilum TaxID=47803 RepID=A0A8H5KG16_9HYPO|nr:hypothetical protein FPHYL_516 [Fusarium phyllophilum]
MNESQHTKRHPPRETESDRPKKQQKRTPKETPSDVAQTAARNCLEQNPIYEGHLLDDHLSPDPPTTSNSVHEAEAMALFDASQSKVDFEMFRPKEGTNNPTINDFRSLWKVCLRVFEWSPVLLISPLNGLKYRSVATKAQQSTHGPESSEPADDADQSDNPQDPERSQSSKGKRPSGAIFSPDFSRILTALIVHPCWEGDVVLFILALQFTVKCRVDNREPWPRHDLLFRVSGLMTLRSMFDDPDRKPVRIAEMFNTVYNSQAEDNRSTFSRFLHFLGDQVKSTPNDVSQPQAYLGVDALPVTLKDLKFLTAAVTKFDWGMDSWNCSPDEVWRAYRSQRGLGRDEVPTTNAETKMYTLRSLKDVYREIASQIRASRDGASRVETPHRAIPDDNQEDDAQGGGEDSPIDDQFQPARGDSMDMLAGNVSNIPRESTAFPPQPRDREPRRKALVGGEETEDEEEDLRRNQRSEDLSQETQVMQAVTRRDQIGRGMLSGPSSQPPYTEFAATASFTRAPTLLSPMTPFVSGETLSERLNSDEQRLESRFAYTERIIKSIQDTQKSHGEAISDLQRRTELQIRPRNEAESVNVAATTQGVTVLETENEQLVQQNQALQKRIDQMAKDAEQHQAEWSGKVEASEVEKSALLATMSQNEERFKAEMSKLSARKIEWSQKAKTLDQEKVSLLGIIAERNEALALQSEKVRRLEARLKATKGIRPETTPSMEIPVQPNSDNTSVRRNLVPVTQHSTSDPDATLESQVNRRNGGPSPIEEPRE